MFGIEGKTNDILPVQLISDEWILCFFIKNCDHGTKYTHIQYVFYRRQTQTLGSKSTSMKKQWTMKDLSKIGNNTRMV